MIHSDQAVDHPEAPVEPDVTSGVPETVLDLPGFRVLAAAEYGGELEVLVETTTTIVVCRRCGRRASSHARREHVLRDIAVSGRATVLVWWKRIWRCRNLSCPIVTWSETMPGIDALAALTDRVRAWAARQVGQHANTVASVARGLGTGWATVMRAVAAVSGRWAACQNIGRPSISLMGMSRHGDTRTSARLARCVPRKTRTSANVQGPG